MERIEYIEAYLENRLQREEKARFEQEMVASPDFRNEVEEWRNIFVGIRSAGEAAFIEKVATWEKDLRAKDVAESPSETKTPIKKLGGGSGKWAYWVSAAACIVMVSYYGFTRFQESSAQDLFTHNFEAYPSMADVRGEKDEAAALYVMKNYGNAALAYDKLAQNTPDQKEMANFYAGISYLAEGKLTEAKSRLAEVQKSGNPNYTDAAEWYLALATLKEGKKSEAKSQLEKIVAKPGHEFQGKAKAMLADW